MTLSTPDTMSFYVHFAELKQRVLRSLVIFFLCFVGCYAFAESIYNILITPLAAAYPDPTNKRLIYTGLTEAFFTYVHVAFFGAIALSFPFIATQLYRFLAPGLYTQERHVILPYFIATPLLFVAGAVLVYAYIFPMAWSFFLSFETSNTLLPIQLEAKVSEYLSLVMHLMIAFGIAFQLPVLLVLLVHAKLIETKTLATRRKVAVVMILIAAAILTPPDVISQIGLAVPMYLLYEVAIYIGYRIEKKRQV